MPNTARRLLPTSPKHQQVFEKLSQDILSGTYQPGQRLPSEAALVRQFETSRITVGRALRDLAQRGLIHRVPGSGTFVSRNLAGQQGLSFGLLIPDLGTTEIFEPICHGMAGAPEASAFTLLWGHRDENATKENAAVALAKRFVKQKVSGVFFAPLELVPYKEEANHIIIERLEAARVPIVLLDRDWIAFPQRSRHDLVGIDNRRAGYMITEHLLKLGVRKIAFVAHERATATVEARIAGYREAMHAYGCSRKIVRIDLQDQAQVEAAARDFTVDALIGVNDRTAGALMLSALRTGRRVPQDLRIAGVDDIETSKLLPVPLTTIHQPVREIGRAAVRVMMERIAEPRMPVRDIFVDFKIVVRESCGAALPPGAPSAPLHVS